MTYTSTAYNIPCRRSNCVVPRPNLQYEYHRHSTYWGNKCSHIIQHHTFFHDIKEGAYTLFCSSNEINPLQHTYLTLHSHCTAYSLSIYSSFIRCIRRYRIHIYTVKMKVTTCLLLAVAGWHDCVVHARTETRPGVSKTTDTSSSSSSNTRIINGQIAQEGRYPYAVSMVTRSGSHFCGGKVWL